MLKKYVALLSMILIFIIAGLFAKGGIAIEENNVGVKMLREQASKLKQGMTMSEVVQLIGEPTLNIGSGRYIPVYIFGVNTLTLDIRGFDDKLYAARNCDGFDLLSTEYTAKIADFPVLLDNEEMITLNPIVTINDKAYVPLKELEAYFGIKVEWNKESQQVEIIYEN